MKKFIIGLVISSLAIFSFPSSSAKAAEVNLIPNPTLQTVDSQKQPVGWHQSQWGNLRATFRYNPQYGAKTPGSLVITVASYSSGDAKWYFEPVDITPNTQYVFSDYYHSNVTTSIIAEYTLTDSSLSYAYLGAANPASAWKQISFAFQTPAQAKKITIFHLISSAGTLQTDDFVLKKPRPSTITDNIPNYSLEQGSDVNSNQPQDWTSNSWGQNQARFTYLSEGHTGTQSVKTEITAYKDGDAKWYYTSQSMPGGKSFQFSDYYKSNVLSRVVLQITRTDDSVQYLGLRSASSTSSWTKYSDIFTTPADTKSLTVFHLISSVGFLITDDYAITSYTGSGFNRPLLTLTFDDSWEDNYTTVLPALNNYSFKSTQFYSTTYIQNNLVEQYKIKAFADAGHEIGSHSITHPFLTQVSTSQLTNELKNSKQYLESLIGKPMTSFATPYGDYNSSVISNIKNYYTANRNTDAGYNRKESLDPYNIRVQNITNTTTVEEVKSWINQAIAENSWLVIVYHRVANNPDLYDTTPDKFNLELEYIKQSGVTVSTIHDALAELSPQTN